MSDFRTRILGIAALGIAMAGFSYGQTITTTTATAATTNNTLRAEGATELVGQTTTVVTATNGINITGATVYVTMSLPVTSKFISSTSTDALLTVTPAGGGPSTYAGSVSGSVATFTGVAFPASGGAGTVDTLTIDNIRVNAVGAGNPSVTQSVLIQYPNPAAASGSANTIGNPAGPVAVAYILPSLSVFVSTAANDTTKTFIPSFATCTGGTSLTNITQTAVNAPSFFVNVKELTAGAWKTQAQENGSSGAGTVGAAEATQATQVTLAFANLPTAATLYMPLSLTVGGTIITLTGGPSTVTLAATVVAFVPAAPPTPSYVAFSAASGTVSVTYAVTQALAPQTAVFSVPVWVSFRGNAAAANTTAMTVLASYAPAATLTGPATLIPTFGPNTATPTNLETITNCSTTLMFPFVTNVTGFETGIAIANTTTDNLGNFLSPTGSTATPVSGACTINFYAGGTSTQPAAFVTPIIGVGATAVGGAVYANTLSAMSGATNFTGYAIASCPFNLAHGFTYIVNNFGTANGTAEGFPAIVIPNGRGEGLGTGQ